jgi:hypothetical protein
MDIDNIVAGLSETQRAAIIQCVDALSHLAGDGFYSAEDAIFDLFVAFDGDPDLTYEQWVRSALGGFDSG